MSDAAHIRAMLAELERLWLCYPEMRLGQLLVVTSTAARVTPYYVEDAALLAAMRKKLESAPR